jgi:hypothetical protein
LVEWIVNDIYASMRLVHSSSWQQTFSGEHHMIKTLRRSLR